MFYTIYRVRNNINNKEYTGQHTILNLDDGYMGSGLHLKYAMKKYGVENFTKTILFLCDSYDEMNNIEKLIVNLDYVNKENTYNINEGGHNGKRGQAAIIKQKQTWNNKTKEEINMISKKCQLTMSLKSQEEINMINKKRSETLKAKTAQEKEDCKLKQYLAWGKRTEEQKIETSKEKSESLKISHKNRTSEQKKHKAQEQSKTYYNESEEIKRIRAQKISDSLKDRSKEDKKVHYDKVSKSNSGIQKKSQCPYCNLVGGVSNMTRYHFDNCKNKGDM